MDRAADPGAARAAAAPSGAPPDAPRALEARSRATILEWIRAIAMPVVTVVLTVVGGYYFTSLAKAREVREGNERLYAQLLTQREGSDALIRKDMFGVVIKSFLEDPSKGDWSNKVLQLELLAANFNQSLDLAPLFKDLARRLSGRSGLPIAQRQELKKRLDLTAANVIFKQVNSLARRGLVEGRAVPLAGWQASFGSPFIDVTVAQSRLVPPGANGGGAADGRIRFSVEIVDVDIDRREVEIRLRADFSGEDDQDVDRHFWVGQYDFPMLDNTQLPYGLRAAVVITDFFVPGAGATTKPDREANSFVKFHLVVFPAASASFKERQDYDDILIDMLRAQESRTESRGTSP